MNEDLNADDFITQPKHAPVPYRGDLGMVATDSNGGNSLASTVRSICCAAGIVALALTGHVDGTYALIALSGIAVPGILDSFLTVAAKLKGAK